MRFLYSGLARRRNTCSGGEGKWGMRGVRWGPPKEGRQAGI